MAQPGAGAGGGGGDAHQQLEDWPLYQHVSKINLLIVLTYLFYISNDPKLSLKEFVKRDCRYYLTQLESKMLTNWIWGPRQNRESHKSILKPIEKVKYNIKQDTAHRDNYSSLLLETLKVLFDERNKQIITKVVTMWKFYIQSLLR